jgi:chemotaxis protein MotB
MAKRGKNGNERAPIVIRREEPAEHGHHGGAWKIAYADFVTAMMAFFLLMWLVNATTEAQRRGVADYFAPVNPLGRAPTGSGQPFGGRTLASQGSMVSDGVLAPLLRAADPSARLDEEDEEDPAPSMSPRAAAPAAAPDAAVPLDGGRAAAAPAEPPEPRPRDQQQDLRSEPRSQDQQQNSRSDERRQREALAEVAEEIRQAVRTDPQLAALSRQLIVEEVPEGLRIQVVDSDGQPVFATGQAAPNDRGRALLHRVAATVARLPHPLDVTGHTDAAPFRGASERSNWELSAERANATRRLLLEAGVAEQRIHAVAGRADRVPLRDTQPLDPANRRVAILVLLPQPSARPEAGRTP